MISALSVFPVSTTCQKYDYDSSTVRKKFFREALLQIMIPYMLQHLKPSCSTVSSTQHTLTLAVLSLQSLNSTVCQCNQQTILPS